MSELAVLSTVCQRFCHPQLFRQELGHSVRQDFCNTYVFTRTVNQPEQSGDSLMCFVKLGSVECQAGFSNTLFYTVKLINLI